MIQYNAISLIGKIRERANRLIIEELKARGIEELSPSHGGILVALFRRERMTMNEIAQSIDRTKPTVTTLVNKLLAADLVVRQKDLVDQRITYISLTEKGRDLEPIFNEVSNLLNSVVYGQLDSSEQQELERILKKVLDSF